MSRFDRRTFLAQLAAAGLANGTLYTTTLSAAGSARRKMTIDLSCGRIGVKANQQKAIDLAHRHGFESVDAIPSDLARLSDNELADLQAEMRTKRVVFGASGVPVQFRQDEQTFQQGMKGLPAAAQALERAGVTRVGTYISPMHDTLTYMQNFRQHVRRLRQIAKVLADHGQRFGFEYVGPKTLWTARRHPFIHTMAETKDLIAAIGTENVGFVLDSWHWYTAGEAEADLLTLKNKDIVAVDLNDAPAGIPVDRQIDSKRELPLATGVIDVATFLNALNRLGYDGPVHAEPFNAALRKLPTEQAVAATAASMKKAFALID